MPLYVSRPWMQSLSWPRQMNVIIFAFAFASNHLCEGAIYPLAVEITDTIAYIYSEGPMFSRADRPFGDSESTISVDFVVEWDFSKVQTPSMLNIIHFNVNNREAIGYAVDEHGTVGTRADMCCTAKLIYQGSCNTIGEVWWGGKTRRLAKAKKEKNGKGAKKRDEKANQPDSNKDSNQPDSHKDSNQPDSNKDGKVIHHRSGLPSTASVLLKSTAPMHVAHSFDVEQTGEQYIALVVCPATDDAPQSIDIQGSVTFKNPYGYLAARRIGFLPYYGTLSGMYAILFLIFLYLCIRNCDMLLHLQYLLFGIIILSFLESIAWFVLYLDLDVSGFPVCCPLHVGATIAVSMNVVKRAVSRCLLLAVCLGYGVVRPSLNKKTTATIVFLGILYASLALNNDIRINNQDLPDTDWWGVPVTVLDMVFVVWIYQALSQVQEDLKLTRQTVKGTMYKRLYYTLIAFVLMWATFSIFIAFVSRGWIVLGWRYQWMLHCFWHDSYFVILAVICWVWAPSAAAHKYAYSFQLPSSAEEADAYEMELAHTTAVSNDDRDQEEIADV